MEGSVNLTHDARDNLDAAISLSLGALVLGHPDQQIKLQRRLAAALTTQGAVNDPDAMAELPNFEAFAEVVPFLDPDEDIPMPHPVWTDSGFIAPAVAAMAQFLDRMLDPHGNSLFTLQVTEDNDSLYGYRLKSLTITAHEQQDDGTWQARDITDDDWMRASIMLSGAAIFFLKELDWMRFAPHFLHVEATRSGPKESMSDAHRGKASSFVEIV